MPSKTTLFFILFVLALISLAACGPATQPPTAEQGTVATIVAATQTALAQVTPAASPTAQPTQPAPTQPEPTAIPATPTLPPSPTAEPSRAVRIAYIKGGDVYLWTEGVGSVGLTDTHDAIDVQISSDGELIAYLRQDPDNALEQELWAVNTSGSPMEHVLVSSTELAEHFPVDPDFYPSSIGVYDFAWRRGTHELFYNTLLLHEGPGFMPSHDLYRVDADTLDKTTLLAKGEGGLFYLSPDGNQIALSKPESISLVDADGSNLRTDVLTYPLVITYSEYQYHPHPIWAADSSSLRVTIPPADPLAEPLQATGLWRIPVDGSPAVLLGNIYAIPFAWPNNAFAPDFEKVAYAMQVGEPTDNQRELHLANPDGSNDVAYDSGESLEFKLWSPDSQHFIYEVNGGANEGLYVGAPDGEPVLLHPDQRLVSGIQWLDSARFAYLLANGEQRELHIMDLEGNVLAFIDTLPDDFPAFDVLP
jgi:hypothetical protein